MLIYHYQAGAELNLKDGQQLTALHHACMGCYHECVQVLLANGADVSLGDQVCSMHTIY